MKTNGAVENQKGKHTLVEYYESAERKLHLAFFKSNTSKSLF